MMGDVPPQIHEGDNAQKLRDHLAQISHSPSFAQAPQLRQFLEFLVVETIEGRGDELKEANLGRDVFRRGVGYDPRTDAIVRVQASILRKRLATYYDTDGKASRVRIVLPKGGYVPQFTWLVEPDSQNGHAETSGEASTAVVQSPPATPAGVEAPATPGIPPSRRGLLLGGLAFAGGAGIASMGFLAAGRSRSSRDLALAPSATSFNARKVSPRIWGLLLDEGVPVQLAFGCPQFFNASGLYIRDVRVNDTSGESAARLQELGQRLERYFVPVPNTYTGVGEMRGIHQVTRFLAYEGIDAGFENAQLLTLEQIQSKTLILISSHRFRTLLDLLDLPRAYRSDYQGSGGFALAEDKAAAATVFTSRGSGGSQVSYGLVSLWLNPTTGGKILLLSGIDSWATYGAAVYVTSQPHLQDLESRLEPSFPGNHAGVQVLLRMEGHDNQLSSVRYHSHRLLQSEGVSPGTQVAG